MTKKSVSTSQTPRPPPHWPPELRYSTSSRYHPSVSSSIIAHINPTSNNSNHLLDHSSFSKHPKVVIRKISDACHPANGQYGLFAAQKIPPRTHILDYVGEIHCDERPHSDYDLSLCRFPDGTNVGIDASTMGNEARFVNDYRGISARANALFIDRRTPSGSLKMGVWSSTEEIRKGEEILVSYGKSWWRCRTENQEQPEVT